MIDHDFLTELQNEIVENAPRFYMGAWISHDYNRLDEGCTVCAAGMASILCRVKNGVLDAPVAEQLQRDELVDDIFPSGERLGAGFPGLSDAIRGMGSDLQAAKEEECHWFFVFERWPMAAQFAYEATAVFFNEKDTGDFSRVFEECSIGTLEERIAEAAVACTLLEAFKLHNTANFDVINRHLDDLLNEHLLAKACSPWAERILDAIH